jgi:hypothetical protein
MRLGSAMVRDPAAIEPYLLEIRFGILRQARTGA